MSHIDFLLARLRARADAPALAFRNRIISGSELADLTEQRINWAERRGIGLATPVILKGDYSFDTTALLLALIARDAITIPLTGALFQALGEQIEEVGARFVIDATGNEVLLEQRAGAAPNQHYRYLTERQSPGLVLYTSGSTGRPKAVIHDFAGLLKKFETPRPPMVTVNLLMFDHWGGLNTLLHCLSSGSLAILPDSRHPQDICRLIEDFRIELLPATPSFLNLLLISGAFERYDLSSLKIISYGAEPMPEATLRRLCEIMPNVEFRQTYGMIEVGVMRAKSKSSDSLWVKIGGKNCDLRVIEGILQIKTEAVMLGYLNEPSPFTEDGYLITGDLVEQDGEYLHFLGRASDLINVAGRKVYPIQVETVILEVPGVIDTVVYGEPNLVVGNIVVADVIAAPDQDPTQLRLDIRRHCHSKLEAYCAPMKVNFRRDGLDGHRLKRERNPGKKVLA